MSQYLLNLHTVVASYLYVLIRITSIFVSMPVIGTRLVPARIRIILGILITVVVAPMLPSISAIDPFSLLGFMTAAVQVLIGVVIGLVVQITFQVVILGGQVMSMQCGLGFATMNDPQTSVTMPMISQFYLMAVTLVFLALNGHLLIIKLVIDSFNSLPVGMNFFNHLQIDKLLHFTAIMFSGAISIALPAIISILVVNFTFGIMTKAAPQLNIFSIGFPITLVFGLSIMCLTFPIMMSNVQDIMAQSFQLISKMLGAS